MERRQFIKSSLAASTLAAVPLVSYNTKNTFVPTRITQLAKPVAIAMWDFSWLLRHHRLGSFENWDKVLDDLAGRGYNAIRMDCFPHLVAADNKGKVREEFYHPKDNWRPALWGNQYSTYSRPREALLEFLPKCKERGIHVGLSTWMLDHGTGRCRTIEGLDGFVRVWDETLQFLDNHNLLEGSFYIDLLNEYPLWHGFEWLKNELNQIVAKKVIAKSNPDANIPDADNVKTDEIFHSPTQETFYKSFMTNAIKQLKAKWPNLDFFTSLTMNPGTPWQVMDFSEFSVLDTHLWFVCNPDFADSTNYWQGIHSMKNDLLFEKTYKDMQAYWQQNKQALISWADGELRLRADVSKKHNLVCGNTEGWGAIIWNKHPSLDWKFIKEAGDICVDLAVKHGFKFICTSNFTHPHFPEIWNDVKWHRDITNSIKSGL